ncbi:uncharacterized protein F5891DRAFT_1063835 [Suillus fuscotomentosus]|uniref:Uncharacterized protein n=1 Tax=Suillus fuscotomentosus TaxID=1912939 RepID=A0AAD4HFY1_9AGAM|nr:uncharacterized protein F5891DRAFT_1063835 [Suillus fuscotomentosus]KAG1894074.1 hypothetical protein F5891DRAFT_1063835 [Suillus fuscotomentosus]
MLIINLVYYMAKRSSSPSSMLFQPPYGLNGSRSLVDVLRGDAMRSNELRMILFCFIFACGGLMYGHEQPTNEFEFPVASSHHAGETYLVPELLEKTWVSLSSGPLRRRITPRLTCFDATWRQGLA